MRVSPRPSISCGLGFERRELDGHAGQRALSAGVVEVEEVVVLHLAARDDGRLRVGHEEVHAHRGAERHRIRASR